MMAKKFIILLIFVLFIFQTHQGQKSTSSSSQTFAFGELNLLFPSPSQLYTPTVQEQNIKIPNTEQNLSKLVYVPYPTVYKTFRYPSMNFFQLYGRNQHSSSLVLLSRFSRRINGTGNNLFHPLWGSSHIPLRRMTQNNYSDYLSHPNHYEVNPREISNRIGKIKFPIKRDQNNITSSLTFWGQFIDHDIGLTEVNDEPMPIKVPECDFFMDKYCKGIYEIQFNRSFYTTSSSEQARAQVNFVTAWIDGSQIYGSDEDTTKGLRSFQKGKLRTSEGHLMPQKNDRFRSFLAGDVRANENLILTSYHTVFLREHNRLCDIVLEINPYMQDEAIFKIARNYVIGLVQKITMYDFLPLMIGQKFHAQLIGQYKGYNPNLNPNLVNEFSTAAFRVGHSLILDKYPFINKYGETQKQLHLHEMFFRPNFFNQTSMQNLLRGASETIMKKRNSQMVNELRNLLIPSSEDRATNLDLFALNIQRAKDHGLPSYNKVRQAYGLKKLQTFYEMVDDQQKAQELKKIYHTPDNCDSWVGIICQKSLENAVLGQLGATIVGTQFRNLRNGDKFWFEKQYPRSIIAEIFTTTFSDIIMRNTKIVGLQQNIFKYEKMG